MKAGEADYLATQCRPSRHEQDPTQPVKLFVVRIKPKDKPLVEEVAPPQ